MKLRTSLLAAGALLALLGGSAAFAQIPRVTSVSPTDLFQDVVNGIPGPGNSYATGAQVSGISAYKNGGVVSTAWTYTFTSGQQYYFVQPAGTLATGTLTTEANPGDGQRECFFSTQTQTAITWTANTGQTIDGSKPTAGVANTLQCMIYVAASASWFRIQ